MVNSQFVNPTANRTAIAKVAQPDAVETRTNEGYCTLILKLVQPI